MDAGTAAIHIVGSGWSEGELPTGAVRLFESAECAIILKTRRCGCAGYLAAMGREYQTLDSLYECAGDFDELNERAARQVIEAAAGRPVVYVVASLSDTSVKRLMELAGGCVGEIISGAPGGGLAAFAGSNYRTAAAGDIPALRQDTSCPLMITEISSVLLASEAKIRLMNWYPEEHPVYLLRGGKIARVKLYELDREGDFDHTTAALLPPTARFDPEGKGTLDDLHEIVRALRAPDGCPWDREQTHLSLRQYAIEEAYEVADAIDKGDAYDLADELGDLILQVALHAEIAREHGEFDISDVTSAICRKMITRHPHVFGSASADTPGEVHEIWQQAKQSEKNYATAADRLRGVTSSLPALMRAEKVVSRAREAKGGARSNGADELAASAAEMLKGTDWSSGSAEAAGEALGDILLILSELSAGRKISSELMLRAATDRYIEAFEGTGADERQQTE